LPTWVPKTRVNKSKRRIPGEELRVHHVLPRGPHNASIKIIINIIIIIINIIIKIIKIIIIIIGVVLLTGIREHSGNNSGHFQGTFRALSGHFQGTFRAYSVSIRRTFRKHSVNIQ
jgi:hypothetical protein